MSVTLWMAKSENALVNVRQASTSSLAPLIVCPLGTSVHSQSSATRSPKAIQSRFVSASPSLRTTSMLPSTDTCADKHNELKFFDDDNRLVRLDLHEPRRIEHLQQRISATE